jgi:hypothetical protein
MLQTKYRADSEILQTLDTAALIVRHEFNSLNGHFLVLELVVHG